MSNIFEITSKPPTVSVDDVLEECKDLDAVIVIGWRGDDFHMSTSQTNVSDNLLLLELAKRLALNVVFE
jgi:hypothetical protein